jgi:hypothetical protein
MANLADYRTLRDRPFLIIQFSRVPTVTQGPHKVRTERKGWMNQQGNLSINEHPSIVDRVTHKVMLKAGIIIDLQTNTVVKNQLTDNDDKVVEHFIRKYEAMINDGKVRFALRNQIV